MIVLILLAGVIVAGAFAAPSRRAETIKKIQDCIDHWGSECAEPDFRLLNGIKKRHLIEVLPASASVPSPVVCEEDATAQRCTSVHWTNMHLRRCPDGTWTAGTACVMIKSD